MSHQDVQFPSFRLLIHGRLNKNCDLRDGIYRQQKKVGGVSQEVKEVI
jgi:hypothetical protein